MSPAIRCQDLRKTYPAKPPVEALRGLDLEVQAGTCFGLLGPNGAGKTTAVEIMEGILAPTAGSVEVLGTTWAAGGPELRQRIGVSLQETRLPDRMTVAEIVTLFSSFFRRGRKTAEVVAEVGLAEKADSWVDRLSGGQKQRLAVACALAGDPELLFLDEPTTGLDPQSRRSLWDVIRGLKERGRTVLLTTHYMDEAERLCDRVAVVDGGRIIALDSPAGLIAGLGGEHVVEFALAAGEGPADAALLALPSVRAVRRDAGAWQLTVGEPHLAIPALLARLGPDAPRLSRLTTRAASLEDVFVTLTGRSLRDD